MIVKLFKAGKSFKALSAYLLHDAEDRTTSRRVGWTLTRNCAFDDADSAVHEMLWTCRAADALKRQAGVTAGGRKLQNPVRHLSLNWHPSERPTREQIIEAVDGFLRHMGWQEHQALLVRHTDRDHPHVHIILSAVHPATGLALDSSLEKRRAQKWAKEYERDRQVVWCQERLKPPGQRAASPDRQSWEIFRNYAQQHHRAEAERLADVKFLGGGGPPPQSDRGWKVVKERQKAERIQFFMGGKQAFRDARNAVYREVRAEFRDSWRHYYDARRAGVDQETLAEMKKSILADQKQALEERGAAAIRGLREKRDRRYGALLEEQRLRRAELGEAQARGEHPYAPLDVARTTMSPVEPRQARQSLPEMIPEFYRTRREITGGLAEIHATNKSWPMPDNRRQSFSGDERGRTQNAANAPRRRNGRYRRSTPVDLSDATTDVNATEWSFGARVTLTCRKYRRRFASGGYATDCIRVAAGFDELLEAAMSQLELFYAARIAGQELCGRGDKRAAIAGLRQEREAARISLRRVLMQAKQRAINSVREQRAPRCDALDSQSLPSPPRPQARKPRLMRMTNNEFPKP